jgi:pantetheine-phosphate adenylyltransferase
LKTTAIYPGSFDPVTLGHQDLITRAAHIFPELTVAVAKDTTGKRTLFSTEERVAMLESVLGHLPTVKVEPFEGLLVDYARSRNCGVLVRGVRAFSDFEYEFQMALMNRKMMSEVETLFLMPKEEFSYVSSSLVREVGALGGDITPFVAPNVAALLAAKLEG